LPPRSRYANWIIILFPCALLVIAASRIILLNDLVMNPDEVWSIWQTFGSPGQILTWTPYDWPPGYYLAMGAWRGLVGEYPIMARYLSVLAFMIGASGMYRVMKRLFGQRAGVLSALAYAALAYTILLSTEVRGYALLLGIMPLAFWLTVRYFAYFEIRRGILLGIILAVMFYISVTSMGAFFMLGIYTLIVYRRRIWRWWLPGIVALALAFPEIAAKFALGITRTEATRTQIMPPLPQALVEFYGAYAGYLLVIWAVLFLLAVVLLFYRSAPRREIAAMLIWTIGAPILMYVLNPLLGFFSNRYSWWIMVGLAMMTGWGLALLPRIGVGAISILFMGMMFLPIPIGDYVDLDTLSPLESNFRWLSDHMTTGDVFVADPSNQCGGEEEWDYYIHTYYPGGLQFVQNPAGYRRVWYITRDGQQDAALFGAAAEGRIPGRFVGPPRCLFRLYEAPPDREGVLFENGMRFHGYDIMNGERPWSAPTVRREGEPVRVRLWWSVDRSVELDYSIGTYILYTDGTLVTQIDGSPRLVYPADAPAETSRWIPGQYYVEDRELILPVPMPKITLILSMAVYFWQDGVRVAAPGVDDDMLLRLQTLLVKAY
jgi:hypothetical protein